MTLVIIFIAVVIVVKMPSSYECGVQYQQR